MSAAHASTARAAREPGRVVCDACGREAPRAEMMPDADPDTESGYVGAEGHGCLVVLTPEMRLAGIVVPAPVVAAAPSETPAIAAGTVWERAEAPLPSVARNWSTMDDRAASHSAWRSGSTQQSRGRGINCSRT